MTMTVDTQDGVSIVKLSGRLDSNNAAETEQQAMGLVEKGQKRIVIDMADLGYVSSAGLRVFLVLAKRIKGAGGGLAFHSMSDNVKEVFEVSGFINVLTVCESREDALARV